MMKNIVLMIMVGMLFVFSGCDEELPGFGEPFSKLEGINDSFVLSQVIQVDEVSTLLDNTYEISEAFIGDTPSKISFNSSDFSYTHEPGSAPNLLGDGGTWAFDDNEYPSKVFLSSGGEMIELDLMRTIRTVDPFLALKFTRSCRGNAAVGYIYLFTRE